MEKETEIWIEIAQGKSLRIRASIVEQLIPTPNEPDSERELTVSEFLGFFPALVSGVTLYKPF